MAKIRWVIPVQHSIADTRPGRPNWRWTIDAVLALRAATKEDVAKWIVSHKSGYDPTNARLDLGMLTVNYSGRSGHSYNKTPRRSDSNSPFDALFLAGSHYVIYDPVVHGIWDLQQREGDARFRPVLVESASLVLAERNAKSTGAFDVRNNDDAREKILASSSTAAESPRVF